MLYTINIDFYNVKDVEVKAPGMSLIEWVKRYGSNRQKKILGPIITLFRCHYTHMLRLSNN